MYPRIYTDISNCIRAVLNLKQRRRGVNEVQIVIRGISWRGVHITSSGTSSLRFERRKERWLRKDKWLERHL